MYIFRLPAKAYDIDWSYEGLSAFIAGGRDKYQRKVGTTVIVYRDVFGTISVQLYDTKIAYVSADGIHVPRWVDKHITHATREWLSLITGVHVMSEKFHYNVAGTIIKDRRIVRHV